MLKALHFVGFKDPRYAKDERYERAVRVFGRPDFYHRRWDARAKAEIAPGDIAIFACGSVGDPVNPNAFDDSAQL